MSSEDSQKLINKPTPTGGHKPLRTVSAQPTLYENANNTASNQEKTDLKLNINANVFVPKDKRLDVVKSTPEVNVKENVISQVTPTTSSTIPSTTFTQQGTLPQQTFQSKYFKLN